MRPSCCASRSRFGSDWSLLQPGSEVSASIVLRVSIYTAFPHNFLRPNVLSRSSSRPKKPTAKTCVGSKRAQFWTNANRVGARPIPAREVRQRSVGLRTVVFRVSLNDGSTFDARLDDLHGTCTLVTLTCC